MNDSWDQLGRFLEWGGSPEGAVFILGLGVVGGLATGAILLVIEGVRAFVGGARAALAEDRAKRLVKHGISLHDSQPAPPPGDIQPSSDI